MDNKEQKVNNKVDKRQVKTMVTNMQRSAEVVTGGQ